MSVEAVGTNQVKVTLSFTLANCTTSSTQYYDCGGSPGPFNYTDMFVIPLTLGASCHHGN
ncbi:MAG: hypothetical protein WB783_16605 [Arenicellales bacterium]